MALTRAKDQLRRRLEDPAYVVQFLQRAHEAGETDWFWALKQVYDVWGDRVTEAVARLREERRAEVREAIEGIKDLRKGNTLGGLSLKDLRDEGRP